MRSISRRDLYALGEPLGDSATYERPGDRKRVMGGGGGATSITNWNQGYSDMLTPWQQSVWANSAQAAQAQATDNSEYRKWYTAEIEAQRKWYTSQKQSEIAWQQAAWLAVKTAIDLVIADQMDKRMREIAKDQRDLADRQLKMGEELHARYINKYAPIEDLMADFAKTDWETNRYKPQYLVQQGRAKLDAARAYGKVSSKLNKKFARYCTGANANMIRSVELDRAKMEVDMVNRAWRKEEAIMWDRDDLQWKRLHNIASAGRNLSSEAAQDLSNGIRSAMESNAIRGQAMQGWYGAIGKASTSWFNFGYGQLESQRVGAYGALPYMARAGYVSPGTLGAPGMDTGSGLSPNAAIENSGAGFSSLRAFDNSISLTGSDATGAMFYENDGSPS